jgi:hypothetical protein
VWECPGGSAASAFATNRDRFAIDLAGDDAAVTVGTDVPAGTVWVKTLTDRDAVLPERQKRHSASATARKSWTSLETIVLGTPGCAAYAENHA